MKKQKVTSGMTLDNALTSINKGTHYKDLHGGSENNFNPLFGLEYMTVDINAAEFDIDIRWNIQTVNIPANKRGNLKKYAGKDVDVICTTVASKGARINFYIKEH